MPARLIAIDWGSTNCRAALLDETGAAIEQVKGGAGVIGRPAVDLASQLRAIVRPWRARYGRLPVILAGMIGSRNGMVEAPYVHCPATPQRIAQALCHLDADVLERCWIVPGLQGSTPDEIADVMRGEEVQLCGLLDEPGWEDGTGLAILPGTHSKWVLLRDGAVQHFATAVSGELFAILRQHGSLAPLLEHRPEDGFDSTAFRSGLIHAGRRGGLLHHIFNLRAGAVLGEIPQAELRMRLSALLIGHELREMLPMFPLKFPMPMRVAVVGSVALGQPYCDALAARGVEAEWHCGDRAARRGMLRLARLSAIEEFA